VDHGVDAHERFGELSVGYICYLDDLKSIAVAGVAGFEMIGLDPAGCTAERLSIVRKGNLALTPEHDSLFLKAGGRHGSRGIQKHR
jgi:hypothetical protein